jgi:hypothetical protein
MKSIGLSEIARANGTSRQRVWQLANEVEGLCRQCGEPSH